MFKNKIILIVGGTGSFGNAFLDKILRENFNPKEIRILSRDEKKQDDMRKKYSLDNLKFYIGDVRDLNTINDAMRNVDFVFHAAALKQVPSCEFFPLEAVKTNVLGTNNVLDAAINNHVEKVICLSTDKAAYPINAMGMSKALMEKVVVGKCRNLQNSTTTICLTRYGNVMASRGSVIPLFLKQIDEGKDLTITNPNMTRFMMSLEQAIDLVLYAFEHGDQGDLFVQKAPSATIEVLAKAIIEIKKTSSKIKIIGTRHGEKLYETLVTKEEMINAQDLGKYFRIPTDKRDLNYGKYFSNGDSNLEEIEEYNSHNTNNLNLEGMKNLLKEIGV